MRVKINGEIIPNDLAWIYDFFEVEHFNPAMLDAALEDADPEDRELILEINSPGGYVFAGFETYSLLQELQRNGWTVEAHVTALAASAATTIMSACGKVLCSPIAQIMVHLPMTVTAGNRIDHRDSIDVLKSLEESILNGYVLKSGGKATRDQLRRAMEKSTWMPAQDAIDLGLADGILGDDESILVTGVNIGAMAASVVNSLQEGFDLSFEDLMHRYEEGVRSGLLQPHPLHPVEMQGPEQDLITLCGGEGEPEDHPDDSWKTAARARLAIENLRFPQ